jgi:hypothetical protein
MRLLLDKKPDLKLQILTEEKLDEISDRLEHNPWESFRCFSQEIIVSKLSAQTAKKTPEAVMEDNSVA